ncbi:MAG TPA: flagellar hook-basal body complex protein FliE [Pseudolabrys sp.]|jgi:flagellar hook-basal body complex protein FliE|nr:flagellar hook-basal body complex protein FliE [Pseudolabrys sp.]
MASPLAAAASTYANIARLAADPSRSPAAGLGGLAGKGDGAGGTSFSSVLKQAIDHVNELGQKSDAQMRSAANGKSNMVDVVTAVSETEVAIDAVVAVRDKVIAAYDEIMKMPI